MTPIITIALITGLPVLLIFLLRSDAALVFLALCAGSVLTQFVTDDATNVFKSFIPTNGTTNFSIVNLVLLFGPAVLTALFMRKSVAGAKAMLNIIPAIAVGLVGVLLAIPLLPGGISSNVTSSTIWRSIDQYQSLIVAAAVTFSLLSLWSGRKPTHDKKSKHKK